MSEKTPKKPKGEEPPPKYLNLVFLLDANTHLSPVPFPGMSSCITISTPRETRKTGEIERQIFLAHILDYSTVKGKKVPIPFPVGVFGYLHHATKTKGETLKLDVEHIFRVRIKIIRRLDDGSLQCGYDILVDKIPSTKEFASEAFQTKLNRFKALTKKAEGLIVQELSEKHNFRRLTPKKLGEILDQCASVYNMLFTVPGIEKLRPFKGLVSGMLSVLAEPHVERRLEKVIQLVEYGRAHQEIFQHYVDYYASLEETETKTQDAEGDSQTRLRKDTIRTFSVEELTKIIFRDKIPAYKENIATEEEIVLSETAESSGIAEMREFISSRVIGQDRPIRTAARAFNLAMTGLLPEERPLLVVFFAGATSVGKTEFARALADFLWNREKKTVEDALKEKTRPPFTMDDIEWPPLVEVDCGMFAGSLSHGIANLIGSPSGFTGSKGTQNAQRPILCQKNFPPNRIVVLLFDEIEKAFVDSQDNGAALTGVLMKILDRGRFRNNWNEEIDFTRTIIIFTSNIGSKEIIKSAEGPEIGFAIHHRNVKKKQYSDEDVGHLNDKIYEVTQREFKKIFPPEFRNRIHRFIAFHFLTTGNYHAIITKEFLTIRKKIEKKLAIGGLELTDETTAWLIDEIRMEEGVRKLRDLMTKEISEPLARAYNLGKLCPGKTYEVCIKKTPPKNERNGKSKKAAQKENVQIYFRIKPTPQSS